VSTRSVFQNLRLGQPSATRPLFWRPSPFWTNRQTCQPGLVVDTFGDLSKREMVAKKGDELPTAGLGSIKCVKGCIGSYKRMSWPLAIIVCTGCTFVHTFVKNHLRLTADDNLLYFALHILLNAYVCWSSYPHLLDSLTSRQFITTSGLTFEEHRSIIVIVGFHAYHIVTQWKRLSVSDWLHHLVSVGVSTVLFIQCDHPVGCTVLFFICGLPGLLDYVVLIGQKAGWVQRITQKHISSLIQITLRIPGILWCCFLSYEIGLGHPKRVYFNTTSLLSSINALYFGYTAICHYGKAVGYAEGHL